MENIFEKIEKKDKFFSKKTGVHFFTYLLVGGIGNCIEIVILLMLVEIFNIWYLYASIITFTLGTILSFGMRKIFIFKNKGFKKIHKQIASYIFMFIIELCINYFIMTFFVEIFKLHYLMAYITSILIASVTGIAGFLWNKNVTFR
ncbi:MAG: GtrA family protein [Patescibacteria group bacterium]|nr:GtrA family protein [Patescibacteria group bacterium]MDD4304315.1 GtrA family protein [Patescibacteria group bacterium]MDD4695578.1 GtrA family protein [Patescibacteria group bacterium]